MWGFFVVFCVYVFVLFLFFLSLYFVSLYEEGVYLRRNENHRKPYLAKARRLLQNCLCES